MAEHAEIALLFCGQGMTNWIEYYPNDKAMKDNKPTMLVLVDLGGDSDSAVSYIVGRLQTFTTAMGATPSIDRVIFSHQDRDHWELITPFLAALKKAKLTVTVGEIRFAGADWKPQATNAVKKLADATGAKKRTFGSYVTNYVGDGSIVEKGNCRVRLVIANCPCADKGSGMLENGTSAVIAIELGGKSIILPGDATWETLKYINDLCKKSSKPEPCYGLSVPHHGSLRTSVEGYRKNKDVEKMGWDHVTTFVKNLKPQQLGASAGYKNTHSHPMTEIIKEFEKYATSPNTEHYLETFSFADNDWEHPTRLTPVWTTVTYSETKPPPAPPAKKAKGAGGAAAPTLVVEFQNIFFSLDSTGKASVRSEPHRGPRPPPPSPTVAAPPTTAELDAHRDRTRDAAE